MTEDEKKEDIKEENIVAVPKKGFDARMIFTIVLLLVIVVLIITGVGIYKFKREDTFFKSVANIVPFPMAMIEMKPIYVSDFWKEVDISIKACEFSGASQDCSVDDTKKKAVQDGMIYEKVVTDLAQKNGAKVEQAKIDEQYKTVVDQNGGDKQFEELLKTRFGWTAADFKKRIYFNLLAADLEDKVIEKVSARHILVVTKEGATEDEINQAKQKAQEALDKIKAGEDFSVVAQQYSGDPGSKDKGGELGFFSRGMMVPEFENVAFSLNKGQVSDLVKSDYGWHIIKVEDKKGTVQDSFMNWVNSEKGKMKVWTFLNY